VIGHWLLAVLVRGTATVDDIDAHLTRPMRALMREQRVDGYRLGGQVTGGWDPTYDPAADPANWRPCGTCAGSARVGGNRCTVCAAAEDVGRTAGAVLAWHYADWAPHPGDIVPLPRLLDPAWRFPHGHTPIAWVDLAGVVWLGTETAVLAGTDTGEIPPRLRRVFDDLLAGRRNPEPGVRKRNRRPFDPAGYAVAVVDAHH
jgi:hypothetical protein